MGEGAVGLTHPTRPCPAPNRPSWSSSTPTRSRASSTGSWRSTRASNHLLRHGGIRPEVVRDLVLRHPVHAGPVRPAPHRAVHRRLRRRGGRGGARGGQGDLLRGFPRLGPLRRQRLQHHRRGGGARGHQGRRTVRSWPDSADADRCPGGDRAGRPAGRAAPGAARWSGLRRLATARTRPDCGHSDPRDDRRRTSGHSPPPDSDALASGLETAEIVVAAGAAGVILLPESIRRSLPNLKVAIDLNAVPPLGIEGIAATDKNTDRDGVRSWGALGIGGTKMKIHKKAIQELFTANDKVLDAEEVLALGRELGVTATWSASSAPTRGRAASTCSCWSTARLPTRPDFRPRRSATTPAALVSSAPPLGADRPDRGAVGIRPAAGPGRGIRPRTTSIRCRWSGPISGERTSASSGSGRGSAPWPARGSRSSSCPGGIHLARSLLIARSTRSTWGPPTRWPSPRWRCGSTGEAAPGDWSEATFAVVELGSAFAAVLVVEGGRLVDASAGTRGPIGVRSGGCWDGEVAYWRSPLSKDDLFRGGLLDLGPDGPDAFRESLIKHVAGLKAVTPFDRLYLSGASAERPEIAALAATRRSRQFGDLDPPALARRAPGSSTPRRAPRSWPTAWRAGATPTSSRRSSCTRPRGPSSRALVSLEHTCRSEGRGGERPPASRL